MNLNEINKLKGLLNEVKKVEKFDEQDGYCKKYAVHYITRMIERRIYAESQRQSLTK
jgi:hypothetical protein